MKSTNDTALGWIGSGINAILAGIQVDEVLRYINISLAIVTTIVTLAYTLYKWYKRAKADGKITADEIREGIGYVKDGVDEIKQIADNKGSHSKEDE